MRASPGIGGATMISSILSGSPALRQIAATVYKCNRTNGVHTYETYNATKKDIKKYRKRKKAGAMMAHLYILWVVLQLLLIYVPW